MCKKLIPLENVSSNVWHNCTLNKFYNGDSFNAHGHAKTIWMSLDLLGKTSPGIEPMGQYCNRDMMQSLTSMPIIKWW